MGSIVFFIIVILPVIVMIFMGLGHALRAFNRAYHARGAFAVVLALFGLNMIEPAVNTPLIPALLSLGVYEPPFDGSVTMQSVLLITSPMLVLLLPALGLFLREEKYRALCSKVLALGLARWAVTTLIWMFVAYEQIFPAVVMFFIGVALLGYGVRWGKRQLATTLTFEPQQSIWDLAEPKTAA